MLTAGIGGRNLFGIGEVVGGIDAINENHAWFGIVIGGLHDLVPQIPRLHRVIHLAFEHQIPRTIRLDRGHEIIGDENGQVEHAQSHSV